MSLPREILTVWRGFLLFVGYRSFTFLPLKRSVAHTAGRAQRRQESRERSYYHLHRQLNDALLLHNLKIEV